MERIKEEQLPLQERFTLISCSKEIHDIISKYTKQDNNTIEKVNIFEGLTETEIGFMRIQDLLNPLNVKGKLMTAGVNVDILEKFIPKYSNAVWDLIYPMIKT